MLGVIVMLYSFSSYRISIILMILYHSPWKFLSSHRHSYYPLCSPEFCPSKRELMIIHVCCIVYNPIEWTIGDLLLHNQWSWRNWCDWCKILIWRNVMTRQFNQCDFRVANLIFYFEATKVTWLINYARRKLFAFLCLLTSSQNRSIRDYQVFTGWDDHRHGSASRELLWDVGMNIFIELEM